MIQRKHNTEKGGNNTEGGFESRTRYKLKSRSESDFCRFKISRPDPAPLPVCSFSYLSTQFFYKLSNCISNFLGAVFL